jgi:hypothetical protein
LKEQDLRRIVRYTATHHRVFHEPERGKVAHTAASKLLAENDMVGDLMGLTFEECWPAHTKVSLLFLSRRRIPIERGLKTYATAYFGVFQGVTKGSIGTLSPILYYQITNHQLIILSQAVDAIGERSEEPNVSGYAFANSTNLNTFEFFAQNPNRAQRFAGAMSSTSAASLKALSSYFDWSSLAPNSTVVDIGGSQGHVSVHLAQEFPHLRFIVQDMHEVIEGAEAKIPEGLKDRVELMVHDMFTQQPVEGADVYLLRYVLHDWPDKYCIKVLQELVPSLKKGAKIVIQDHLLPEPGTLSLLQEMQIRYVHLTFQRSRILAMTFQQKTPRSRLV